MKLLKQIKNISLVPDKWIYALIAVVCAFVLMPNILGQEIYLKAELDTQIIRIGEQAELDIELTKPYDVKIDFPVFTDTLVTGIEILRRTPVDTTKKDAKSDILKQKYYLTSFDTGIYRIPPIPFYLDFGDRKDTFYSNPLAMAVFTIPIDTSEAIFDIKAPLEVGYSIYEVLPYLGILIFLLFIGFGIYLLIRKKKGKEPVFKKSLKPEEPAHIIALRELDDLKKAKLWQQNKIKEYYSRLTEIIRRYIERRYSIMAMEQTSPEIIEAFQKIHGLDDSLKEKLSILLSLADLIKFAKGTALPDENDRHMQNAYEFIDKTKLLVNPDNEEKSEDETKKIELDENNKALNE